MQTKPGSVRSGLIPFDWFSRFVVFGFGMISQKFHQLPRMASQRVLIAVGLSIVCAWSYWPTLSAMWKKWLNDPQYSNGYLVPAFALFLLYLRRSKILLNQIDNSWLWVPLFLGGLGLRTLAAYLYFEWLEAASFVVCLAGIVALAGGRSGLKWAAFSLSFLFLMIPLPYSVETAFAQPLQRFAAQASMYVIRTAGFPALAQGNTIVLANGRLGVEQACSGLSMLLVFIAISTAVVIVTRRPVLDKIVILASALPIAVIANVARISGTGLLQELYGRELAQVVFHDWAGFLMMPLALGLLGGELWLLSCLLRSPTLNEPQGPVLGNPSLLHVRITPKRGASPRVRRSDD